ncbi:MAG TPA: redoxin domain-containing protein [Planctomycetota bacterium]
MMKLHWILALGAALLPAQSPPPGNPAPPEPTKAEAPAGVHASLAELQRDFQERKLAALEAYLKVHATAKDVAEAIVEAVGLAQALERHDQVLLYADRYVKEHAGGPAAPQMRLVRAGAMRDSGDAAGAEKALREVIDNASENVNLVVEAAIMLGDMLVEGGKKQQAVELLNVVGASRPVQGLMEHMAGVAGTYDLIGTEPKPIGKPDLAGKPIDLAEYKGKVVLLDFWATWCGPCIAELPHLLAAYEKYHDKGFEIVGISLDQDPAALERFIAERKMTWRQHMDGKNEVAAAYGVRSIPATFLIGADGKIAAVGLRGDRLGKRLARICAERKAAPEKAGK